MCLPAKAVRLRGNDTGAAVRLSGLQAPRMPWPLDGFVAKAPRNDGRAPLTRSNR
jgi:hypothetical protein